MPQPQITEEEIKQSEVLRYLGYRGQKADEAITEQIRECIHEMLRVIQPRFVYRRFPITFVEEDTMEAGGLVLKSRNLSTNLRGCREVIYFAATLGSGVDRLMTRFGRLNITKAAILQAVGAAAMEAYCDQCQRSLEEELQAEHLFLRPRFSPGYGDFDICYQEPVVRMLNCAKTIGLTLTDSFMMTPTKSVTAVIGISTQKDRCPISGCEVCTKKDCEYRR